MAIIAPSPVAQWFAVVLGAAVTHAAPDGDGVLVSQPIRPAAVAKIERAQDVTVLEDMLDLRLMSGGTHHITVPTDTLLAKTVDGQFCGVVRDTGAKLLTAVGVGVCFADKDGNGRFETVTTSATVARTRLTFEAQLGPGAISAAIDLPYQLAAEASIPVGELRVRYSRAPVAVGPVYGRMVYETCWPTPYRLDRKAAPLCAADRFVQSYNARELQLTGAQGEAVTAFTPIGRMVVTRGEDRHVTASYPDPLTDGPATLTAMPLFYVADEEPPVLIVMPGPPPQR